VSRRNSRPWLHGRGYQQVPVKAHLRPGGGKGLIEPKGPSGWKMAKTFLEMLICHEIQYIKSEFDIIVLVLLETQGSLGPTLSFPWWKCELDKEDLEEESGTPPLFTRIETSK
tara:strand:+ start:482 stop:820 length:339 start_codon:yes stop_codon:yes gene_type:complete